MEAAILVVIMIAGFTYSAIKTKESWKNRCKRTLKEKYGKGASRVDLIDGVGIEYDNWRFNLRPSNTEPLIRFNMETKGDRKLLEDKKKEVMDFIHSLE